MNKFKTFATNHPVLFVLSLVISWFLLGVAFSGMASSVLGKPFGDATTFTIGRLVVTVGILIFLWRLGWLKVSGVARSGSWQVWLIAMGGMIYLAITSLYAFYGKVAFDFHSLIQLPSFSTILITNFVVALSEEILFRGLILYALIRVWGNTRLKLIGSVVLMSLLFGAMHITQVFTSGLPLLVAFLFAVQACIISIWWGALVLMRGSIWPAVAVHFLGNSIVAWQGLIVSMVEPGIFAYERFLWFSTLLGVLGIWMLMRASLHPIVPEDS